MKVCPTCESKIQPVGSGPCLTCGIDSDLIRAVMVPPRAKDLKGFDAAFTNACRKHGLQSVAFVFFDHDNPQQPRECRVLTGGNVYAKRLLDAVLAAGRFVIAADNASGAQEYEKRLDMLIGEAFPVDHPAAQDYALLKMELKRTRKQSESYEPLVAMLKRAALDENYEADDCLALLRELNELE